VTSLLVRVDPCGLTRGTGFLHVPFVSAVEYRTAGSPGPPIERGLARGGRSKQAIADCMLFAPCRLADVIRAFRPKPDAKVVARLCRPLIPYLSRMTPKVEG
jgi:hypothetical protein